ncbi:MAG: 2OG-Fe(II) oxygenase [Pseudomonadota bacterium]
MPAIDLSSLEQKLSSINGQAIRDTFVGDNEFLAIENFLPEDLTEKLIAELNKLEHVVHRNFIPKHKKGGSVSRFDLDKHAACFRDLYEFKPLIDFFSFLADRSLLQCPHDDPHTYALYYYTEPGDHIGYHYDTSYYQGARYTVLVGLVDNSSCKLECQLHKDDPDRTTETVKVRLTPGKLVFFNGDKLYHRITPLGANERRIALTLEYLTSNKMHPWHRFISNMKDAIAYFGFKQVFGLGKN